MDRALVYLRVSTFAQEANGKNLGSQLAEIQSYCEKHGYGFGDGDVFSDVVSGAKTDRAGYYQLLQRVERADAQVLIAYEVSRFGRNGTDNAWLLVKAKEYGFRIETVTGGRDFLADPESEFMFDILSAVAKYERTAILYRMILVKERELAVTGATAQANVDGPILGGHAWEGAAPRVLGALVYMDRDWLVRKHPDGTGPVLEPRCEREGLAGLDFDSHTPGLSLVGDKP